MKALKNALNIVLNKFIAFISSGLFLKIVFAWFLIQAVYMALSTKIGIPPDENYHISFIRLYSESGISPILTGQEGYFALGEAVKTPFFLYHYLMSFPYRLFSEFSGVVFLLRFINISFGAFSLLFVYRIGKSLKLSAPAINTSIFMLSNTIMFVFLSASVNYDNLFILLSLVTVCLVLNLLKALDYRKLLLLIITILGGMLVKVSFFPVVLLVLPVFHKIFVEHTHIFRVFKNEWRKKLNLVLLGTVFVFGFLFSFKYIGNIINYGKYSPSCTQVLTIDQCRQNGIFSRSETYNKSVAPPTPRSTFEYFFDWVVRMQEGTFGIFGHKSTTPTPLIFIGFQLFIIIGFISLVRLIRRQESMIILVVTFIAVYIFILVVKNNSIYEHRGIFELALQGRYAFAVLPLTYLVFNHYIFKLLNKKMYMSIFIVVMLVVFSSGGLPSYILATNPEWHTKPSQNVNRELRSNLIKLVK
jgi:hypothetical protein